MTCEVSRIAIEKHVQIVLFNYAFPGLVTTNPFLHGLAEMAELQRRRRRVAMMVDGNALDATKVRPVREKMKVSAKLVTSSPYLMISIPFFLALLSNV